MRKLLYTTAILATIAITSTAVVAEENHMMDGGKGGPMHGRMMEQVDTDGNGLISKAEFMAKHEEAFTRMDTNGDGSLTPDEMKAAREKMKEKMKSMKDMKEKHGEMKDAPAPVVK